MQYTVILFINTFIFTCKISYYLNPQHFAAVSFDDKILEVVAVFGGVQLGISRVINLQHHRIAQVYRSVTMLYIILIIREITNISPNLKYI